VPGASCAVMATWLSVLQHADSITEQHEGHSVGFLAELISIEPLRDESPASERELPAEQAVEEGEIVRDAMMAEHMPEASQRSVHGADDSCTCYR
jgi:hypothetical protein